MLSIFLYFVEVHCNRLQLHLMFENFFMFWFNTLTLSLFVPEAQI